MISLTVGIGSILFGLGLAHLPNHTKVLSTVQYPPHTGPEHTGHFRPFAWEANCSTPDMSNCTYGVKTKLCAKIMNFVFKTTNCVSKKHKNEKSCIKKPQKRGTLY